MASGKSISFFLIDGTVDGVIACELFNWTGKGYKIPRTLLKTVAARDDLKKAGVYFLVGHDPNSDQPTLYIGEAEEVYKRITQHQEKEFWSEALAFVSKDENLNKAHIKYLEYTLHKDATEAGRYALFNSNTPNRPAISEAEQAVMLEFADNLRVMVGTLGFKFFEPLITKKKTERSETYHIQAPRGASAKGLPTSEGFVVLKGSTIATSDVPSTPFAIKRKRESIVADGSVVENTLTKDILFSSPSLAAAVVLGRSANGRVEWKLKNGATLKDNEVSPNEAVES
ncbi:MAG: GIY-YIG nuclease family protein [Pirellulales bacterium]|nr:GIY-YIG nuclease family protein [Pirellulales bacterium]